MTREEILNALSIENITFGGNSRRLAQFFEALDIVTESYTNIGGDWIPCSERLPEDEKEVLVTLFGDLLEIGWFDLNDNNWRTDEFDCDEGTVIAWMPLPKPWKGE